jgi:hypothetical protein
LEEFDHGYELGGENEVILCEAFHEQGFCIRGISCDYLHVEGALAGRRTQRKVEMMENFPELLAVTGLRRAKSFLQ